MIAVDLDRRGIVGAAAAAQVERAAVGSEDEQLGEFVLEMLGLERLTGQEYEPGDHEEA
jgi:hypothetical protein